MVTNAHTIYRGLFVGGVILSSAGDGAGADVAAAAALRARLMNRLMARKFAQARGGAGPITWKRSTLN